MRTALVALVLACAAAARAQAPVPEEKVKAILNEGLETVLVVIADTSGSMRDQPASGGGQAKIEIARGALKSFVEGLPGEVQTGLMIFWGCHVRWMAQPAPDSRPAIGREIAAMQPRGSTPIAMSLQSTLSALKAKRDKNPYGRYVILLLTDGEETCSPPAKVAETAQAILAAGIELHVIGFDLPSQDTELKKIGTRYYLASDSKSLTEGLSAVQGELEVGTTMNAIGDGQ